MSLELRRKFVYSLMLGLLLSIGLVLYSDWQELSARLQEFPWLWLPVALALTLVNYVGRLLKWHWYLHDVLHVHITRGESGRIFGVGMMMVMTPGKAGEFLKSYMVRNVTGTPMSTTAPVILAERITDGTAMLVLASIGLFAFPNLTARTAATVVFIGFLAFFVVVQIRPLALWMLGMSRALPGVKRFAGKLHDLYESSYTLFRPRTLLISLIIGIISWLAEGIAYYVVLVGFGVAPGATTALVAVFIFSISTVIGAVIAMPGGLGGVEGSIVALSTQLLGMDVATAAAAALLVRFCTLWFGVGIGIVSFLLWSNLLAGAENVSAKQPVV